MQHFGPEREGDVELGRPRVLAVVDAMALGRKGVLTYILCSRTTTDFSMVHLSSLPVFTGEAIYCRNDRDGRSSEGLDENLTTTYRPLY